MAKAGERTYHIRPALNGQTLAAAVRVLVTGTSWADARQLVHDRHVSVNGNLSLDDTRRVKAGDVVKIFEHARPAVPSERDVRVLHLDADLIVIDKPPGITTLRHAEERGWDDRRKQRQPTLDEVLQKMLPSVIQSHRDRAGPRVGHPLARGAQDKVVPKQHGRVSGKEALPPPRVARVRAVHRLDRDTSGLMIFALSPRAEQALVQLFKDHAIRRSYWAVAVGRVEPRTIESWLLRDRGDGLRGSSREGKDDPDAQHAVTHVKPIEHLGDRYTVVGCRLETGRTHQIRIHLAEAGHMLCGEKVYVRPAVGAPPLTDPSGAPRQALHSHELAFTHPITNQPMMFTAPVPRDLAEWVGRLRVNVRP
ncbi:MAG TPA: RluA family pseudouridine synthase [Tepidisphaeraceae bacterium]|nr:RluA family pseudouridine synthase [Tepidisphaeraceae bacterium]